MHTHSCLSLTVHLKYQIQHIQLLSHCAVIAGILLAQLTRRQFREAMIKEPLEFIRYLVPSLSCGHPLIMCFVLSL